MWRWWKVAMRDGARRLRRRHRQRLHRRRTGEDAWRLGLAAGVGLGDDVTDGRAGPGGRADRPDDG